MSGKYDPLEAYLRRRQSSEQHVTMSFDEINKILGSALPRSAYERRQWWENPRDFSERPQAKAWLTAGFEVDSVQQQSHSGTVRFRRR